MEKRSLVLLNSSKAQTEVATLGLSSFNASGCLGGCILTTHYYHTVLIPRLILKLHRNALSELQISRLDVSVCLHSD